MDSLFLKCLGHSGQPPNLVPHPPSFLAVLAAAALAAALCCQGGAKRLHLHMPSSGSGSGSSRNSSSNTAAAVAKNEAVHWLAEARRLSIEVLKTEGVWGAGKRGSGRADLAVGGRKGGQWGGSRQEEGEVLAALLWAHGFGGVDLRSDGEARYVPCGCDAAFCICSNCRVCGHCVPGPLAEFVPFTQADMQPHAGSASFFM